MDVLTWTRREISEGRGDSVGSIPSCPLIGRNIRLSWAMNPVDSKPQTLNLTRPNYKELQSPSQEASPHRFC